MKKFIGSAIVFGSLVLAVPALAQTEQEMMMERGEGMMQMMMGSGHEAFESELEAQKGGAYVDSMHETLGRMGAQGSTSGTGMMAMMRMMGGGYSKGMMGDAIGYHAFVSWLWVIVWTANSILVGLALWTYVRKTGK